MAALCLGVAGLAQAEVIEPVDLDMVSRIRQEAFHRSQVMDTFGYLTEEIGPRLSNSPAMARANAWTRGRFEQWGLVNVRDEAFDGFGRGWEFDSASVEMLGPRVLPLHALPKAWTPGTNGPVEGELVQVAIKTKADLDKYKGQLRGKIVLLDEAREYKRATEPDSRRHTEATLADLHHFELPRPATAADRLKRTREFVERQELGEATRRFFADEGVLAAIGISGWDNGIIRVTGGGSRKAGEPVGVPELVMISEHYNPLVRALERKETVRLRVNVDSRFTDQADQPGYNTVAEIRGSGKADEIVMLGAHMDSWHSGTGASDNAAGVAVMMEAMRILKAVGAKPKRTVRVALWSGEEQGLVGSQAYVAEHFAAYPAPTDPAELKLPAALRTPTGALQRKRDYERFSAYFNLDNGSGRIRGIYAQENMAVVPIFKAWLAPFADVGATEVVSRNTGSTDHISFDRVGLPGFQFVQDRLDYSTNVHHSHLDTYDHAEPDDLRQAAAIVATFVYQAAMRDQKLPRKPLLEGN